MAFVFFSSYRRRAASLRASLEAKRTKEGNVSQRRVNEREETVVARPDSLKAQEARENGV